jgi:hypothetical protein
VMRQLRRRLRTRSCGLSGQRGPRRLRQGRELRVHFTRRASVWGRGHCVGTDLNQRSHAEMSLNSWGC